MDLELQRRRAERLGDLARAKELEVYRDKLITQWRTQIDVERREAEAWLRAQPVYCAPNTILVTACKRRWSEPRTILDITKQLYRERKEKYEITPRRRPA